MIIVYLVIACIFGFMMWYETTEDNEDGIDFYASGIGSAMTYLAIIGLSLFWPILLWWVLYSMVKESPP